MKIKIKEVDVKVLKICMFYFHFQITDEIVLDLEHMDHNIKHISVNFKVFSSEEDTGKDYFKTISVDVQKQFNLNITR